jgi:hypothetical protein
LYERIITVLIGQLGHVPYDFFIDELAKDNFLKRALKDLIEIVADSLVPTTLHAKIAELMQLLKLKFQWTFPAGAGSTAKIIKPKMAGTAARAAQRQRQQATATASMDDGDEVEDDDEYAPVVVELPNGANF